MLYDELNQLMNLENIVDQKLPWPFYEFLLRTLACGWAPCCDSNTVNQKICKPNRLAEKNFRHIIRKNMNGCI